jgi:MFS family permease
MNRRILFTLLLAVFIALTGVGVIAPIMPLYATNLGASGVMLGLMIAAFSISRGVLQPFIGGLSDRYGKKSFMVIGLTIYALVGLAYVIAASVGQLILIRVLNGVGSAMVVPVAMAIVGELAPEHQEGRYMGMLNIAIFAGIGGGPIIGGIFVDSLGMHSAFYVMAGFSILAALCVLVLLPSAGRAEPEGVVPPLLKTFSRIVAERQFVGVLVSRMATMIVMIPTLGFLPLLMNRFMESSGLDIGLVIASRTLVNATLQTPFGKLADRYDRRTLIAAGTSVMVVAMFLVPFMISLPTLMVVFAFLGAGEAVVWPVLGAYAVDAGHRHGQGAVMGIFNMSMSVGILAGSLIAGSFMDALGIRSVFFVVAGVLLLASAAAVVLIGPQANNVTYRTAGEQE